MMSRSHSMRAASSASSSTASNRHGGVRAQARRGRRARRRRSARAWPRVMLAAAPPKSRRVRSRTSTNTSVSPSRAMRSISPRRRRKLRSTIVRPRRGEEGGGQRLGARAGLARARRRTRAVASARAPARHDAAGAELHQPALADELARRVERQMAGGAVELELRRASRPRTPARRGRRRCRARRAGRARRWDSRGASGPANAARVGIDEPRDVDEAHVVEVAQRFAAAGAR